MKLTIIFVISLVAANVMAIDVKKQYGKGQSTDQGCFAILYQHGDFTGWAAEFTEGEYSMNMMAKAGAKNDDASALQVFGSGCCAVVYEHDGFGGWSADFPDGDYDYQNFVQDTRVQNDKLSSIKVFSGGCPTEACGATLYQHGDFQGWSANFAEGSFDLDQMRNAGAKNDDASAIKVRGGPDCCAIVYEHDHFKGWAGAFTPADYSYSEFVSQGGVENDRVSSIRVRSDGCSEPCSATLYQHSGFGGWNADFEEGFYDLNDIISRGGKNDDASAIKVRGGPDCCAIIYQHDNFNGQATTFPTADYDFKQFTGRGAQNDQMSSIIVQNGGCK